MRRDRLPRPDRAELAGGVVAHGEDEVHRRRAGRSELVPALRAQAVHRDVLVAQQVQCVGMRRALGVAAGAEGAEATAAETVQQRLGQDAARRVPGAQEQHVVGGLRHASSRSEEHTSELQSLMRSSYAVFCLKKKKNKKNQE